MRSVRPRRTDSREAKNQRRKDSAGLIVLGTVAALAPLSLAAVCLHVLTPLAIKQLDGILGIMAITAAAGIAFTLLALIRKRT